MADTTVVYSSPLQGTNTAGEGAPQGHSILKLHTCIIPLIGVLGFCLQLKFPNLSPYETAYGTIVMDLFIIDTFFYVVSLVVMGTQAARDHADLKDLMNKISLLLGTLSLILELIVLISPFGLIALLVWSISLLCFVSKSYEKLKKLYHSAIAHLVQEFGELKQKMIDWYRRLMDSNVIAALARGYQKLKDLFIRNDGRMTEHEAEVQNHTTVSIDSLLGP